MSKLTGQILYKTFAEGSKSESSRPYICLENGTQILLYKKNDFIAITTGDSCFMPQIIAFNYQ